MVGFRQVGIQLLAHRQVGDAQHRVTLIGTLDGQHPEVEEQALEVLRIDHPLGREGSDNLCRDTAFGNDLLDDGSVHSEGLVYLHQMAELVVVRPDIAVNHCLGRHLLLQVAVEEIKRHVGVEHVLVQLAGRETVIVIPRTHHLYQPLHGDVGRQGTPILVVSQHLPHFFRAESDDAIEQRAHADVRSDVEPAGHVVHRDGAYTRDKQAVHGRISVGSGSFHHVEEAANEAVAVRGATIVVLFARGEDGVGKVVVLVNHQVNARAINTADILFQGGEHLPGVCLVTSDHLPNSMPQQVFIFQDEVLHHHAAIFTEPLFQVFRSSLDFRKVEAEHHIFILPSGGVLTDV